jgi:hypothetical protein
MAGVLTASAVANSASSSCSSRSCRHRTSTSTTSTTATSQTTTTATTSTTTSTTTTTTTTTVGGGSETYDQAIAYTQVRPPFTALREVDVGDATGFKNALANLQPGDLVKATAPFTVSGETIIGAKLSSPAVIDLTAGVTFDNNTTSNVPALYLNDPSNLRIYGGTFTTDDTGGFCVVAHGAQHVLMWGFVAHDCGNSGVYLTTIGAAFTDNDFQGEVYKAGENLNWDPHAEKGTGLHGVLLWDAGTDTHDFARNRFAFYAHDQPSGAGISYGTPTAAANMGGNIIYEKAVNVTDVALVQVGGNALQFWGAAGGYGVDVKYLEATNTKGRALDANGESGTELAGVTVEYGIASNTNQNTLMNEPISPSVVWDPRGGAVYQNVAPAA